MCEYTTEYICRNLKFTHERLELVSQILKTEKRDFRLAPVIKSKTEDSEIYG